VCVPKSLDDGGWEKGGLRITGRGEGGERLRSNPTHACFTHMIGTGTNLGTRVEPQQIVAQRLLSCLQYPVLTKSSTEDLTRSTFRLRCNGVLLYLYTNSDQGGYRRSSRDSVLEAFRHNPTDGSFAALATQPTALPNIRTNGSSRTKLDYCNDDNLISRVKLTCLTTV
jgi:hypothetical protein